MTEKICTVPWTNDFGLGGNGKGANSGTSTTNNAQMTTDLQSRLDDDTCTIVQLPFGRAQCPALSHSQRPACVCPGVFLLLSNKCLPSSYLAQFRFARLGRSLRRVHASGEFSAEAYFQPRLIRR